MGMNPGSESYLKANWPMFPIESFRKTLSKFVEILQKHEVPFHLTGGLTSVAYGEPRFTQDIDIVIQNKAVKASIADFAQSLVDAKFLFERVSFIRAIADGKLFQLFDLVESLKLDVYPRELIPGELSRSVEFEIFPEVFLPIVCRADAAASKLVWISKGSHKSRKDLRQLMSGADSDERTRVEQFATESGFGELLNEVLAESEEIDRS